MTWMTILSVWALCVFFMVCMLILGKRADRKNKLLVMDRCGDSRRLNVLALSPRHAGGPLQKLGSLRPQQNPLSMRSVQVS